MVMPMKEIAHVVRRFVFCGNSQPFPRFIRGSTREAGHSRRKSASHSMLSAKIRRDIGLSNQNERWRYDPAESSLADTAAGIKARSQLKHQEGNTPTKTFPCA